MATAPKLPPITNSTGFLPENPYLVNISCFVLFVLRFLIGAPTYSPFLKSKAVSGNVVKTFIEYFAIILFAIPAVTSLSCEITGILRLFAAITVGTETYPPFEKITSGFILSIIFPASRIPLITFMGIKKFLSVNFRLSFAQVILK